MVSVAEGDDPAFLAEVNAHCVDAPELHRRGHFHGHWAELDDSVAFHAKEPLKILKARWEAARPIVLHDALSDATLDAASAPLATASEGASLVDPKGLNAFLHPREQRLAPEFRLQRPIEERGRSKGQNLPDERDLARAFVSYQAPKDGGPRSQGKAAKGPARVSNLWIKSQRLSLYPDDASVRVRFSFGEEGTDDASRDMPRHRLVADMTQRLMPEAAALAEEEDLLNLIAGWIGAPPILTQGIAYWNAPNGGALFHHDAFDEPERGRQRGVLYAQITGSTAWLALSTEDMVARVQEFTELMEDGTLSAARRALIEEQDNGGDVLELVSRPADLARELSQPGCGILGPLVNYGPDFTSLCTDAGHGYVLAPGDVILLPNHGYASTCMHSVFCASDEAGFALSSAIRGTTDGQNARRGHSRRGPGRPRRRRRSSRGNRPRSRRP
ncbi:MAG: hypothetical protein AAGG01_19925 [Planctomycetota bacterium]